MSEHQMGPGPGYVPRKTPERPASETTRAAALRRLRQALARTGQPCRCGHGTYVHRHANPAANHCGIRDCGCTAYRKAST